MSETTETKDKKKAGWSEAIGASAEAQKPKDPTERQYVDQLRVPLNDKELIALQDEISDLEKELEAFEEHFETLKANHKAAVKAKKAVIAEKSQQRRDKHRMRPVKCIEYVSFSLCERWRVRTDTGERIASETLSPDERQALLFPDDPEDGQFDLPGVASDPPPSDPFGSEGADEDDDDEEPPPGTVITEPGKVLGKSRKAKR